MRRGAPRVGLALASCVAAFSGCGGEDPRTELIVVVDTDLSVPAEVDSLQIEVTRPDGTMETALARLGAGERPLPRTLGLVHQGGALGPVLVVATARLGTTVVVERRARVSFVRSQTLVLRIDLRRVCRMVSCPAEETCAGGTCRSVDVPQAELEPWTGMVDRLDGGPQPDAPACECSPPRAMGACVDDVCTIVACDSGYDDCNSRVDDGCEAALSEAATCGRCDTACAAPTPLCASDGAGGFACTAMCTPPQVTCDTSCVDTSMDVMHCGMCDRPCADPPHATPSCAMGVCGLTCDSGFHDCDGDPATGCESELRDSANCTACGVPCELANAVESCGTGVCTVVSCNAGFDNCDARPENGCEQSLMVTTSCGACGTVCSRDHASADCSTGTCRIGTCDPGWADCDGDPLTGCEASLARPATCGSCTVACDALTPLCAGDATSGYSCTDTCPTAGDAICSGECVDTATDPRHCGMCGMACTPPPGASAVCAAGACGFVCDAGSSDCDGMAATGCESTLRELTDCGSCGTACTRANATPTCATGMCAIATCNPGFGNCDMMDATGCETDTRTSSDHCGRCGLRCSGGRTCCMGVCQRTCP